jgi:ribosomal protein L12E/L44/L45/RPP1/RPP2
MTPAEKDYLKKIAENSAIKNDPKTIKAIISALEKSD